MNRSAGVLLHPTCLPSAHGIGDLGPNAHAYLDWLAEAGVSWWQILPLNPPGPGHSPYSATSTFAGNPLLISPRLLVEDGLLDERDLVSETALPDEWVDYGAVIPHKHRLIRLAFDAHATRTGGLGGDVDDFRHRNRSWLDDYALFAALKEEQEGRPWTAWRPAACCWPPPVPATCACPTSSRPCWRPPGW